MLSWLRNMNMDLYPRVRNKSFRYFIFFMTLTVAASPPPSSAPSSSSSSLPSPSSSPSSLPSLSSSPSSLHLHPHFYFLVTFTFGFISIFMSKRKRVAEVSISIHFFDTSPLFGESMKKGKMSGMWYVCSLTVTPVPSGMVLHTMCLQLSCFTNLSFKLNVIQNMGQLW